MEEMTRRTGCGRGEPRTKNRTGVPLVPPKDSAMRQEGISACQADQGRDVAGRGRMCLGMWGLAARRNLQGKLSLQCSRPCPKGQESQAQFQRQPGPRGAAVMGCSQQQEVQVTLRVG